ncbi:MAG TPA: hypothetical protein VJU15_01285, partial [Gemmatimonadales bacterium]|nr:hypothetical protein [Gemmatimonadales bacterium]
PLEAQPADSAPIERWRVGTATRDTVAWYPLPPRSKRDLPPGEGWRAFEATAQWAVAPDGSIAIVRPEPYSVVLITASGVRVRGKPLTYARIKVSAAHKEAWLGEQTRHRPVLIQSPGKPTPTAGLRATKPFEPIQWPTYLPPFLDHALHFAPDGTLWIQRTNAVVDRMIFDLVGSQGTAKKQVVSRLRGRLIGLGRKCVYIVHTDKDQQEFLARYCGVESSR